MLGLLSLIPHRFNTGVPGWGHDVGVAGWNTSAACSNAAPAVWWGWGLARCWVLRRHPVLLVVVFFLAAPGLGRLTLSVVGVVVVVVGWGVVVC